MRAVVLAGQALVVEVAVAELAFVGKAVVLAV